MHATRGDEKKQSNDANAATTTADIYGYDECIQQKTVVQIKWNFLFRYILSI